MPLIVASVLEDVTEGDWGFSRRSSLESVEYFARQFSRPVV
jgi:hypothetical protein